MSQITQLIQLFLGPVPGHKFSGKLTPFLTGIMLAFQENLFFRLSVTREIIRLSLSLKGVPFGRVYFGTLTDSNFLSYSATFFKGLVIIRSLC